MEKNIVANNKSFKPIFVQDEMSSSYLSYAMSVMLVGLFLTLEMDLSQFIEELYAQCIKADMIGGNHLENLLV